MWHDVEVRMNFLDRREELVEHTVGCISYATPCPCHVVMLTSRRLTNFTHIRHITKAAMYLYLRWHDITAHLIIP